MGHGSLKSGVARFCWSSEIIGVWIRFCWVLLVVGDHRCLGPILLGFVGRQRSSVFGFDFAGFCWSSEIVSVWVRFCWVFVGNLWVLFWQWWVVGDG